MYRGLWRNFAITGFCALLSACNSSTPLNNPIKDGAPKDSVDVSRIPDAKPVKLPKSPYGNPTSYEVYGKRYHVLETAKHYNQRGIASWYGTKFAGRMTSSHEPYNMYAMTAASPVLPIPSFVRVTNLANGRQVVVKVNDRGPFAPNRILDLSYAAAKKLGYQEIGTAVVQVTAIDVDHPNSNTPIEMIKHPKMYLQIGAFSQLANAQRLQQKLTSLTHKTVRIDHIHHANSSIYKVQIGPLKSVGESDILQAKIEHRGYGNAITVIS